MLGTLWRTTRPSFLVLAPACVLLGAGAMHVQGYEIPFALLLRVLLGAVLAHAAVNVLNEYLDFRSGLDLQTRRTPFSGGSGALPANPEAAPAVLVLAVVLILGTISVGLTLLSQGGAIPLLIIGVIGIAVVLAYTRVLNRSPLACLIAPGLGFGLLIVNGSGVALAGQGSALLLWLSLVPFFQVGNLLLLNQFPDVDADRVAGRRHAVIAWGSRFSLHVYGLMVVASLLVLILTPVVFTAVSWSFILSVIPALTAVKAWQQARSDIRLGEPIRTSALGLNVVASVLTPAVAAGLLFVS